MNLYLRTLSWSKIHLCFTSSEKSWKHLKLCGMFHFRGTACFRAVAHTGTLLTYKETHTQHNTSRKELCVQPVLKEFISSSLNSPTICFCYEEWLKLDKGRADAELAWLLTIAEQSVNLPVLFDCSRLSVLNEKTKSHANRCSLFLFGWIGGRLFVVS